MNCTLLQGWLLPAHLFVQLLLLPSLLEGPHLYLAVPNLHLFACCLSYLLSKNLFFLVNIRFCTLCLIVGLCLMLLLHLNESCCCHNCNLHIQPFKCAFAQLHRLEQTYLIRKSLVGQRVFYLIRPFSPLLPWLTSVCERGSVGFWKLSRYLHKLAIARALGEILIII